MYVDRGNKANRQRESLSNLTNHKIAANQIYSNSVALQMLKIPDNYENGNQAMAMNFNTTIQPRENSRACIQLSKIVESEGKKVTLSSFDPAIKLGEGAEKICGLLTIIIIGGHSVVVFEWHNPEGQDTLVCHLLFADKEKTKGIIESRVHATHEEEEAYERDKTLTQPPPFILARAVANLQNIIYSKEIPATDIDRVKEELSQEIGKKSEYKYEESDCNTWAFGFMNRYPGKIVIERMPQKEI